MVQYSIYLQFDNLSMQISDQQKSLRTFLNNIPYISTQVVFEHLSRFIRENQYFWVRSNVDKAANNQFFSYIEVVGFVMVNNAMIQFRMLIPHNYPSAPPQFDLRYNPQQFTIVNEGLMIRNQVITMRRNEANEQFIRLNFDCIKRLWATERKHICDAFKQISKDINNPPILAPRVGEIQIESQHSINDFRMARNKSTDLTQRLMQDIEMEIVTLQEKQSKAEGIKRELFYRQARADFVRRNGPRLEKALRMEEGKVNRELQVLRARHSEVEVKSNVDSLLEMSEQDRAKIAAIAKRAALKEAEATVSKCLERGLGESTNGGGFEENKNVVRQMYEQMFQAQLEYLKNCS